MKGEWGERTAELQTPFSVGYKVMDDEGEQKREDEGEDEGKGQMRRSRRYLGFMHLTLTVTRFTLKKLAHPFPQCPGPRRPPFLSDTCDRNTLGAAWVKYYFIS